MKFLFSLFPATRRCMIFAMPGGNNFGHNGERHFFWRSGSNIQAYWAMNVGDLFIRQPLLLETFIALLTSFAAADGPNVSYLPRQHHFQRGFIEFRIMCEDSYRC